MKILFYNTKDFEIPFLENENDAMNVIAFSKKPLSLLTAKKAKHFDAISLSTHDDASASVLQALHRNGVRLMVIRMPGCNNADLAMAASLGIDVETVPELAAQSVAEHAVGLILALNRKIITADKQVHHQIFKIDNLDGTNLNGKTVGVIGVGKIGGEFVKNMHGFGCRLLGYDNIENKTLLMNMGWNMLIYLHYAAILQSSAYTPALTRILYAC